MTQTTDVEKAREYIALFAKHTMPGVQWVDTNKCRIYLDRMTDAEAIFVAAQFRLIEIEDARRAKVIQ